MGARPGKRQFRKIEMMLDVATREVELTRVKVASLEGDFRLTVEVTRVEKPTLRELGNPKYREMLDRYSHLKVVKMSDEYTKPMLPVHLTLGASEFARIKTERGPRNGKPGEPVEEKTRFGWTIMYPGSEPALSKMLLTQITNVSAAWTCLGCKTMRLGTRKRCIASSGSSYSNVLRDGTKRDSLGRVTIHPYQSTREAVFAGWIPFYEKWREGTF